MRLPVGVRIEQAELEPVVVDGEGRAVRAQAQGKRARLDRERERGNCRRAPEQGREQRPLRRGRAVEVDRLARQQHRHVDPRLDHGLGAELAAERDGGLVLGRLALRERDDPCDDGEGEQHADSRE